MRLEFLIENAKPDEIHIIGDFCRELVSSIQLDLYKSMNRMKLVTREKYLLNSNWILWSSNKPNHINMIFLYNLIVKNIKFYKRRNTYVVEVNRHIKMPYSNTSLEKISRFLDKGNEVMVGIYTFSKVFNKYRRRLRRYWKAFASMKLGRIEVSEVIVIQ